MKKKATHNQRMLRKRLERDSEKRRIFERVDSWKQDTEEKWEREKLFFIKQQSTLDEEKTHSKLYKCWKYNVKFPSRGRKKKRENCEHLSEICCTTNTFNGVELGHINVSTQLCQRSEKLTRIFLLFPSVSSVSLALSSLVDRVALLHQQKTELSWLPLSLYNLDYMIRWGGLANTSARKDCAWRQWERKDTKRSDTHTNAGSARDRWQRENRKLFEAPFSHRFAADTPSRKHWAEEKKK